MNVLCIKGQAHIQQGRNLPPQVMSEPREVVIVLRAQILDGNVLDHGGGGRGEAASREEGEGERRRSPGWGVNKVGSLKMKEGRGGVGEDRAGDKVKGPYLSLC